MSWITPTTTWSDSDTPTPSDFDRIEGNTDYLKDAVDDNDSDILSSASSITSLDGRVTTIEGTLANGVTLNTSSIVTQDTVFDLLSPIIDTIGDKCLISGSGLDSYSGSGFVTYYYHNFSYAERIDANTIEVYGTKLTWTISAAIDNDVSQSVETTTAVNGNSSTLFYALVIASVIKL